MTITRELESNNRKVSAKYALYVNEGYSSALIGLSFLRNPYQGEEAEAWAYGYRKAQDL